MDITSKQYISETMGDNFVDAIYSGTTADTSSDGFDKGLYDIARVIHEDGTISVDHAARIMEADNPGPEYRPYLFTNNLAYYNQRDGITK